jgi:copper(I)-binding protein
MTLINASGNVLELTGASSNAFGKVEFHEMVGGMMSELKAIKLANGEQIQFKPGGKHLMLKNPKKVLVEGDRIDVILTFSSGVKQRLSLAVEK